MIYVNLVLGLLLGVLMLAFWRYDYQRLKAAYHPRGIFRLTYPLACFIYGHSFGKRYEKKAYLLRRLFPQEDPRIKYESRYLKSISWGLLVFLLANFLAFGAGWQMENRSVIEDGFFIIRNDHGKGARFVALRAFVGEEEKEITVEVGEKRFAPKEYEVLEDTCNAYLEENVLAQNKDADHVMDKLDFFSTIPSYSVGVAWETSDYMVVGPDGTVNNQELSEPVRVELTAHCTYFDHSWDHRFEVEVLPEQRDASALMEAAFKDALTASEHNTLQEAYLELPRSVGGQTVRWEPAGELGAGILFLLALVGIGLILVRENEIYTKGEKRREQQLIRDYPVFVHKVVLLLGTGMTPKAVWLKIIEDYESSLSEGGEQHYVYEEMIVTANEMKKGITEIAAYERFGRRCGTSQYLKFSSIMIQSVKTGARGLGRMLSDIGDEAVVLRRELARRLGETAGTKLLFPMVVLLGIIMVIVMIPAFMSMNL